MLFAAPLLVSAAIAGDRGVEITPVVGFRDGATLHPENGEGRAEANPSLSFGLIGDFPVRDDGRIEAFFDRQVLEFSSDAPSGSEPFDLTIDYLQVGGVYEPVRRKSRPFVAAAVGLSRLDATSARVDHSVALSGSLGGGFKVPLGARLALRLELRGYASLTETAIQATCGPGCNIELHADGWYQFAGRVGLVLRLQ